MFGIADFGAFCLAVIVFLAVPGPGTLALLDATGKGGFKAGAAATLGLIAGDQCLLWLAVGGVAALLVTYPLAFHAVQYAGVAYLVWVGFKLMGAKPGGSAPIIRIRAGQYFHQAFLVTLLNPKAIIFYMAFFPLFINPATHHGLPTFLAMATTIAVLTAGYCLSLCAFANALAARVRTHQALTQWLSCLAGVFLIGCGIRLIKN